MIDVLADDVQRVIKEAARNRAGSIPGSDVADIEQDLTLALLTVDAEPGKAFDPAKGEAGAWARGVLNLEVKQMIHDATCQPLTVTDGHHQHRAEFNRDAESLEMRELIENLPPDLQPLAAELLHYSLDEAAGNLGITRMVARGQIERIQEIWKDFAPNH